MNSSCELASKETTPVVLGSRVLRFQLPADGESPCRWEGVPVTAYKTAADHHRGVSRAVLAGESGEKTAFQVRYFEIAPGGFSTLEHHEHEHVVVVFRGRGEVVLDNKVHPLSFGDTVYVAPHAPHQFRNPTAEPFGFLCLVDAQRDRPLVLGS